MYCKNAVNGSPNGRPNPSQTVTGFCALNQSIIITGSQVKKEVEHPIYRKYLIEMVMRKGKRRESYEEEEEEEKGECE